MVKSKVLWGAERTPVSWRVDGEDRVGFDDGQSQTPSLGFGNIVPLSPFPHEWQWEGGVGVSRRVSLSE